jgi:hypothetical protein
MWERLQVCPETVEVLDKNGIQLEVLQTEAAVERFNMPRKHARRWAIPFDLLTNRRVMRRRPLISVQEREVARR